MVQPTRKTTWMIPYYGSLLYPKRGSVTAGSLWYNIEQTYLYTIILMSHSSCLYNLHVRYDTMISRICNRNLSRLCKICRSFMPYLNPFTYARTMSRKDTFGIISYSNIVRHDQWPAFLYNLITISSHLNFLLTDRTLRQGSLSTSLLRQGSLSQ